jgi:serine/threonine protein kinase
VIEKETLAKGKAKEKLQSEIMIHKSLRHKHIVKF